MKVGVNHNNPNPCPLLNVWRKKCILFIGIISYLHELVYGQHVEHGPHVKPLSWGPVGENYGLLGAVKACSVVTAYGSNVGIPEIL